MEGSTLSDSTVRHQLAFLNDLRQLLLHLAQCVEVLLLDLPVLDLDDGEVFLVFLGELAETLGIAAGLLREQLLRVLGFVLGRIQKLVQLVLEGLVLHLSQIALILNLLLGLPY